MQRFGPRFAQTRPCRAAALSIAVLFVFATPAAFADSIALNSGVTPVSVTIPGQASAAPAVLVAKKPYWAKPVGASKWIGPDTNSGVNTGPNTTTTYRATFTLPAGFVAPVLQVSVLADNAATVLVNGVQFGQQPQQDLAANYSTPSTFTTSAAQAAAFAAGTNTLTVKVFDTNGVTGLDFSATVSYQTARDVSGVTLSGPATTPTGATSVSLTSLPVGNLVVQRASPTQSAGVDEISTHRISTARISTHRISTHRISTHRISTHRISTHRISTHRIAAALSTHRIGGDGLLAGNDLGALLGNASLASLTLLRDGGWPALLRGTDLEQALPQNTTFAEALRASPAVRELTDPTCDADPSCDPVTLDEFSLDGSPLGDIPWIALLLQGVTWGDIAAPAGWCVDTAGQPIDGCPTLNPNDTILASVLNGVRLDATALGLRRVGDIAAAKRGPLLALSIADLNIAGTVLGDITPSQIAAGGGNVGNLLTATGYADLRTPPRPGRSGARPPSATSDRRSTTSRSPPSSSASSTRTTCRGAARPCRRAPRAALSGPIPHDAAQLRLRAARLLAPVRRGRYGLGRSPGRFRLPARLVTAHRGSGHTGWHGGSGRIRVDPHLGGTGGSPRRRR